MDPELDRLYAMLDKADAAGAQQDARDIAALIKEHKARGPAPASGPTQAGTQRVQSNRGETAQQPQSGVDKFLTGLDRLPNLVGIGNVSSGFTKADIDADEARQRFAQGSGQALQATGRAATNVLGPVDDWVIAGVSEAADAVTGRETGTFDEKVSRTKKFADELREKEGLASLVGDVMGFGYAGNALRAVAAPGAVLKSGIPIVGGVAGEAATIAGLHGFAEGQSADKVAQDALLAATLGKIFQGVGDKVIKPTLNYALPRIERKFSGAAAKATDEFKIPEADVQGIARQLKMPVADIRKALDEYVKVNGVDANILSVVNPETAAKFERLSRGRKGASDTFQAGEEAAALSRPDEVAAALRQTGDTQTASEAIGDVTDIARREAGAVRRTANEAADETTDIVNNQRRLEDDNIAAAKALEDQQIAEAGDSLSAVLQRAGQGIETEEAVDAALRQYTTRLMRREGGLAQQPVKLSPEWVKANMPADPTDVAKILSSKARTMPAGEARDSLIKAAEDLGTGAEVNLKIGDIDTLRRVLSQGGTDANGVKWSLGESANALRAEAAKQVPDYRTKYLDVFAGTKRGLEARRTANLILGKKAPAAAANIEGRVARAAETGGEDAARWLREGARDGALDAIAQSSRGGTEALRTASKILRNADEVRRVAGREGERIVQTVNATMENVARIREEMAEIANIARRNQGQLSEGLAQRLKELRRAATAQIDAIKVTLAKDKNALRAASKVLSSTEGEFAAATAGTTQNVGSVARGAIADEAGQSPASAIKVVEELATPSTGRKLARVAGQETADRAQAIGRTQSRATANYSKASARTKDDGGLPEELATAIEAGASLMGRAGPGYATAVGKRAIKAFQHLGISNNGAKAIASAVLNRDAAYVSRLVNRLAKTEQQRKVIVDAVRSFLLGLNVGNVTSAR